MDASFVIEMVQGGGVIVVWGTLVLLLTMSVYLSSDGCFQKDNVPCQEVADYMLFCCFFLMNIDDLGVSVSH